MSSKRHSPDSDELSINSQLLGDGSSRPILAPEDTNPDKRPRPDVPEALQRLVYEVHQLESEAIRRLIMVSMKELMNRNQLCFSPSNMPNS